MFFIYVEIKKLYFNIYEKKIKLNILECDGSWSSVPLRRMFGEIWLSRIV